MFSQKRAIDYLYMLGLSALFIVFCAVESFATTANTPTGTLVVQLRDYDNPTLPIYVPAGETAYITCWDDSNTTPASGSIGSLGTSANITVLAGLYYRCSLSGISLVAHGESWGFAEPSGSANIYFYVSDPGATLTVNFIDDSFNTLSLPSETSGTITCQTSSNSNITSKTIYGLTSGVTLDLVGGCYTCSFQGSFGNLLPSGEIYQCIMDGESLYRSQQFFELDSEITVNLVDSYSWQAFPLPTGESGTVICNAQTGSALSFSKSVSQGAASVTVAVLGDRTYGCYYQGSMNLTSGYASVYVDHASQVSTSLPVTSLSSTLTVNFVTSGGSPLQVPAYSYPFVSCYSVDQAGSYYQAWPSQDSTSVQFQVNQGNLSCSASGFGAYTLVAPVSVSVAQGSAAGVNLEFYTTDATLSVSLIDSNGAAAAVDAASSASIYCNASDYSTWYSAVIPGGTSLATLQVVGGKTYSCSAWLSSGSSQSGTISVPTGGTAALNLVVSQASASLTLSLKDQNGNPITDLDGQAYANSSTEGSWHYASGVISDGASTLQLVPGIEYSLYAYFYSSGTTYGLITSESGHTYLQATEVVNVNGFAAEATITLYEADATVRVTLGDTNGAPLSGAWVSLNIPGNYTFYMGSSTDSSGVAELKVPGGRTYTVSAYPIDGSIRPEDEEITPPRGQTTNVSMSTVAPDYTLGITASAEGAVSGSFSCSVYTVSGHSAFTEEAKDFGTEAELRFARDLFNPCYVSCYGFGLDADGNHLFYSSMSQLYEPSEGSGEDLTISFASSGAFDAVIEHTSFVAANGTTLDLGETGSLDIPPGVFGEERVVVNVQSDSSPSTGTYTPLRMFDIDVTNEEGEALNLDSGTLELVIEISEADVPAGADAEDLVGAYWTGTEYRPLPTEDIEEESSSSDEPSAELRQIKKAIKLIGGAIASGSKVGLVVRLASAMAPIAPEPPTTITVKVNAKSKATVKWDAPSDATSCSVTLTDVKKDEVVLETTVDAATEQATSAKLKPGKYQASLICSNTAGNGEEATKDFTVKKRKKKSKAK